jgi:hypothetical protein
MSQFIEKLKQVAKGVAPPMGFRTVARAGSLRPLLVASLTDAASPGAGDYIAGADAVLAPLSGAGAKAIKKLAGPKGGIIPGGRLKEAAADKLSKSAAASLDFVVFPAASPSLPVLEAEATGRILEVEASADSVLLRAAARLPVDAVLAGGGEQPLTWQRLMVIQRLADLVDKPLLVPVAAGASQKELQALWDIGVDGFVVEVGAGPKDSLSKLRRVVSGLEPSSKGRSGAQGAIVPPVAGQPEQPDEEEGEFDFP